MASFVARQPKRHAIIRTDVPNHHMIGSAGPIWRSLSCCGGGPDTVLLLTQRGQGVGDMLRQLIPLKSSA